MDFCQWIFGYCTIFQTNPFDSTYSIICPWSSCYHDQNPKWMCLKPAVFWQPSPAGHLCRQQLHRCPLLKCGQKDDATLGWIQITRVVPAFCRWIIARFRGADYLTNFSRFVSGVLGTTQWVVAIVWSSNAKKIMPGYTINGLVYRDAGYKLVGGLEHVFLLGMSSSQLTNSCFSEG